MVEAKERAFYDEDYYAGRTRNSLPHTREVVAPLSRRTARFLCHRCRPQRTLDIGCAMGFLVEALRAQGVRELAEPSPRPFRRESYALADYRVLIRSENPAAAVDDILKLPLF